MTDGDGDGLPIQIGTWAKSRKPIGGCSLCGQPQYEGGTGFHTQLCIEVRELRAKVKKLQLGKYAGWGESK